MKTIRNIIIGATLFVSLNLLYAQTSNRLPAPLDSVVSIAAAEQNLTLMDYASLPAHGTFWLVCSNGQKFPIPNPPQDPTTPVYALDIADNIYLVDGTKGQVAVNHGQTAEATVTAQANTVMDLISQVQETAWERMMVAVLGGEESTNQQDFTSQTSIAQDTNGLYLELTNAAPGLTGLNLRNATNAVYAIWSKTDLLLPWQVETELWPWDTNCQPFTLQNFGRQVLFVRAQDWTEVCSHQDGLPDWWSWYWFGNLNASATNLDDLGNTFAYDFAMGLSPNVIQFSVEATNNYFASMSAPVMANISYGQPGYYATLVDDTNFNHAFWNSYVSSNLTVNLGLVEGWHDVWVGLRGHADTADEAVWQSKQLKLDFTPPALVITGPMVASGAAATVDVPVIQLTGYSPEALGSISYDLSNAAGTVTNQQVLVLNRYYDTNIFEFTTNTFQAFDVVLTNGVNTFTIHATDLAGNVTTLVTNFTLDYSGNTNPPSVQITWPQNGIKIANSSVTIRGQVADATVAVTASVVSTNGTTNTVSGVVERSGRFWLDNLPLNGGTNLLTITASDVVGNAATTNLNLVKDDMTLTLDDIGDLTELWQPVMDLTGEVSDPTACVWVNGVRGTNYGDGTWAASNVPVTEGGVAIFDLNAVPAGEGDPANSVNLDKPAIVYLQRDVQNQTGSTHDNWSGVENDNGNPDDGDENSDSKHNYHYEHDWNSTNGGSGMKYDRNYWVDGWGNVTSNLTSGVMTWGTNSGVEVDTNNDGTTSTFTIGLPLFGNEHCKVKDPQNPPATVYGADGSDDDIVTNTYSETYTRTADTTWHVQTGGRAVFHKQNLWQFSGSAWEVLNKRATPPLPHDRAIDPTQIQIMGTNLDANGVLYTILPDGQDLDATPFVAGKDFYTFNVSGQKYLSYFTVYVQQPHPGTTYTLSDTTGHAFFEFSSDVPDDVLQNLAGNNAIFANNNWGFYPHGSICGLTGWLQDDSDEHGSVKRVFYIGFPDLLAGLKFTSGLNDSPPIYCFAAYGYSCVGAATDAGHSAGISLPTWWNPWNWMPQNFGAAVALKFPGPLVDDTPRYSK
jgi:hypothetical protein